MFFFPTTFLEIAVYEKMGRGRNGLIGQSMKKPKIIKNKERGGVNFEILRTHLKQEKFTPLSLSEGLLAEVKQMRPQSLMNILLPNKNVNREHHPVTSASTSNKCQLSDDIKKLPLELREKIYKEFLTIKLRQRTALGWDKVNAAIAEAPFCEHNEQIVKVLFCHKCRYCRSMSYV